MQSQCTKNIFVNQLNEIISFRVNAHDILEALEAPYSSDEDVESFHTAMVYLQPPNEGDGNITEEESGDEDAVDINHLSRKQLLACGTTATIEQRHEPNEDFDPSNSDIEDSEPVSKKKRKAKKPKWKKCSLTKDEAVERFPWKNPPPNLDYGFSPCKLFEEVLTDEIPSHICQETIRYATSKGRENFTIDLHSLKGFICSLLISKYNALPRHAMYWQPTDDVYNAAVSSIMTRNRFDKIMQNLHLANNDDLDKNDKFAKVRPLINFLNKQCLEHFFAEQHISVDESIVPYYSKLNNIFTANRSNLAIRSGWRQPVLVMFSVVSLPGSWNHSQRTWSWRISCGSVSLQVTER